MMFIGILKKFSVLIVALLALKLTRMGISYLAVLIAIAIVMPIICDNKRSAVVAGILYTTISYLLTYPSSLFLKNYMPDTSIPIAVSSSAVYMNLFMGWIIPVIITMIICGIVSTIIYSIKRSIVKKQDDKNKDVHYFERGDLNKFDTNSLNKKQKKELLYLTPIQKAKNRVEEEENGWNHE